MSLQPLGIQPWHQELLRISDWAQKGLEIKLVGGLRKALMPNYQPRYHSDLDLMVAKSSIPWVHKELLKEGWELKGGVFDNQSLHFYKEGKKFDLLSFSEDEKGFYRDFIHSDPEHLRREQEFSFQSFRFRILPSYWKKVIWESYQDARIPCSGSQEMQQLFETGASLKLFKVPPEGRLPEKEELRFENHSETHPLSQRTLEYTLCQQDFNQLSSEGLSLGRQGSFHFSLTPWPKLLECPQQELKVIHTGFCIEPQTETLHYPLKVDPQKIEIQLWDPKLPWQMRQVRFLNGQEKGLKLLQIRHLLPKILGSTWNKEHSWFEKTSLTTTELTLPTLTQTL